jgi:hypothetical protein
MRIGGRTCNSFRWRSRAEDRASSKPPWREGRPARARDRCAPRREHLCGSSSVACARPLRPVAAGSERASVCEGFLAAPCAPLPLVASRAGSCGRSERGSHGDARPPRRARCGPDVDHVRRAAGVMPSLGEPREWSPSVRRPATTTTIRAPSAARASRPRAGRRRAPRSETRSRRGARGRSRGRHRAAPCASSRRGPC